MLVPTSNLAPQARMLQARPASLRRFQPTSPVLVGRCQQTRGFRFGPSSPRSDHHFHRELRRRHRMVRHKFAETLHRELSWERGPQSAEAQSKHGFRPWGRHYGVPRDPRAWEECHHRTPDNPTGARPGSNIEDVERGALDHLLFGDRDKPRPKAYVYDRWSSTYHNLRNLFAHQQGSTAAEASAQSKRYASTDATAASTSAAPSIEEYVIDPITNRKVRKDIAQAAAAEAEELSDVPADFPYLATDAQKAQFGQEPIFYDGPPPASELREYGQVKIDPITADAHTLQSIVEDVDLPPTAGELRQYGQVRIDDITFAPEATLSQTLTGASSAQAAPAPTPKVENRGPPAAAVSDASETGYLSWKYTGVLGAAPPPQAGLHNIKSDPSILHHASRQVQKSEGTSTKKSTQAAPGTQYSDLHKYKPVMEDSEQHLQQDSAPRYEDLHEYKPVMLEDEPSLLQESTAPPYEDLHKYKPVMHNEPDGKPPGLSEHEIPPELHLYQPFFHNEPDGKAEGFAEPSYDAAELAKYQAVMWNEPDGQPVTEEADTVDPEELQRYTAVRHNEPDGRPLDEVVEEMPSAEELDKYGPVVYNEPDGKPAEADIAVDPVMAPEPEELDQYGPVTYTEPEGKQVPLSEDVPTLETEVPSAPNTELKEYIKPVRHNEPDGKPIAKAGSVEEALREFDEDPANSWVAEASAPPETVEEPFDDVMARLRKLSLKAAEEEQTENLDSLRASDIRAAAGIVENMPRVGLTRNFSRDFPEEFATKWTRDDSPASTLTPAGASFGSATGVQQATARTYASAANLSRLQPSLDRRLRSVFGKKSLSAEQRRLADSDPYSITPQGLETSYVEETGGQRTWPTFVKIYGKVKIGDGSHLAQEAPSTTPRSEPEVYKILAYDSTMQAINTAETTSIVPDTASPLTPAEVLLRLSNPSKFFPHFAPLQAQGFEIVAGSGDVLVFRKVREATTAESSSSSSPAVSSAESNTQSAAAPVVNPIDMMGAPASANFASPTGYVSYDVPEEVARFRSGITVRREEPVFSGPKDTAWSRDETPPKGTKVVRKMALGAAWVAGVSYALGVVGEYFRSGGIDGKGPRGL